MASASEIRNATERYASGRIGAESFQNWFLRISLERYDDSAAAEIGNKIEGLLAESSHAGWTETELREELAKAVRSAVPPLVSVEGIDGAYGKPPSKISRDR